MRALAAAKRDGALPCCQMEGRRLGMGAHEIVDPRTLAGIAEIGRAQAERHREKGQGHARAASTATT